MIHGIINVYKEQGYTSHDVVARLRKIVGQKKIGHTGTLDPDATGVLPVCFGKGTKLCDMLTDRDKTYEAVLLLGKVTDTQDVSGKILSECAADDLSEEQVRTCIGEFLGEYAQIPPMYSALKVNGRKLYELAREGKEIERKARMVRILAIRILEIKLPRVKMEVSCSKGTYIRTLCHDIGEKLGVGGCMENLIRTKSGIFVLEESITLARLEEEKKAGTLNKHVILVDKMFSQYQRVTMQDEKVSLAYNGNTFRKEDIEEFSGIEEKENVRVYDKKNVFIGIYQYHHAVGEFQIVKMFYEKNEPA